MRIEELRGSREVVIKFEIEPEGVYVFISKDPSSPFPEFDYLQDSLEMAIDFCVDDVGIPEDHVRRFVP